MIIIAAVENNILNIVLNYLIDVINVKFVANFEINVEA